MSIDILVRIQYGTQCLMITHMRLKATPVPNHTDLFYLDKENLKEWITSKGWTELHEFKSNNRLSNGDHIPVKDIFKKIDEAEGIGVMLDARLSEDHQLSIMGKQESFLYYINDITMEDLDVQIEQTPSD